MRSELECRDVRSDVSARLDGELDSRREEAIDEHLAGCDECTAFAQRIAAVRQSVRLQPVEQVPDLTERILGAIDDSPPRRTARPFVRTAAIAAAAAALVFLGTSVEIFRRSPDVATAAEVVREVRAAARALSNYQATFVLTEYGWHPEVPRRDMKARVWFAAPERFRIEILDRTDYPQGAWPRNDVSLIASSNRWSITEPSTCPTTSLPACAAGAGTEQRTIVDRQPFDGNSALPTDIAIPLETLSDADSLEVVSSTDTAHRVSLSVEQAAPLLRALQPGGSWRPFHPLDRMDVWVDRDTWFPLRFRVTAGDSPDRELWAERIGAPTDEAGTVLFEARARNFDEPGRLNGELFRSKVVGAVSSGDFTPVRSDEPGLAPRYTSGLTPYRAGSTNGRSMVTFTGGMAWLKIATIPSGGSAAAFGAGAEIVKVGTGEAFYFPADGRNGRRVDIYGESNVRVEANLSRAELLQVAASMGIEGTVPESIRTSDGTVLTRRSTPGVSPVDADAMPLGYELVSVVEATGAQNTSTSYHFHRTEASFEGSGIRVVRSSSFSSLPPSSEEFLNVDVSGQVARWSFERSELEWIRNSTYYAVRVPGSDLATAIGIAEALD